MSNPPKSRHESWKLKSIPLEIQSDSQLLTRVVTLSTNDDDISSSLENEMSEKWRREAVALLERVGSVDEELAGGRLGVMAAQAAGASMRLWRRSLRGKAIPLCLRRTSRLPRGDACPEIRKEERRTNDKVFIVN